MTMNLCQKLRTFGECYSSHSRDAYARLCGSGALIMSLGLLLGSAMLISMVLGIVSISPFYLLS